MSYTTIYNTCDRYSFLITKTVSIQIKVNFIKFNEYCKCIYYCDQENATTFVNCIFIQTNGRTNGLPDYNYNYTAIDCVSDGIRIN